MDEVWVLTEFGCETTVGDVYASLNHAFQCLQQKHGSTRVAWVRNPNCDNYLGYMLVPNEERLESTADYLLSKRFVVR